MVRVPFNRGSQNLPGITIRMVMNGTTGIVLIHTSNRNSEKETLLVLSTLGRVHRSRQKHLGQLISLP